MPVVAPLPSSNPRDREKRRPVPKPVRDAIVLMVYGRPDDPDGRPVDFIEAGKAAGIKPDIMRRWLDKPAVRALIHVERRAFRAAICAGTELSLANIRDHSRNDMARLGAVRVLENIAEEADARPRGTQTIPGFVIVINGPSAHMPRPPTIEATPVLDDAVEHQRELVPKS